MQFMAVLRRRIEAFPESEFAQYLKEEAEGARRLYAQGTVRAAWSREDVPGGAVLLIECGSLDEARAIVGALPLGRREMLEGEVIPLGGYRGFGPRA